MTSTTSAASTTAFGLSPRTTSIALNLGKFVMIGLFALMLIAALHPDVRSSVRGSVMKDFRTIVSTAHGDLLGNGSDLTVAKIRTREGLFIEIYEAHSDGGQRLVERLELADKRDGFFNFNGQATNLAIDDIDGDGRAEILVPTFDQNLVGHLNIYRYNQNSNAFQRSLR